MTTVITTGTALAPLLAASMETASLPELEAVIERGKQTFYEVGAALLTIRDRRLYRDTHATFEDYCRERLDFSRPRAYEFIAAAQVTGLLSAIADTPLPASEAQARELAPLKDEPAAVAAVWREVTEHAEETGERITAAAVRAAVQQHREPSEPEPEPEPESALRAGTFVETIPIPARLPGLKSIDVVLDRNDDDNPASWSAADRQRFHIEVLLDEAEDILRRGGTLLDRNRNAAGEWAPDELPTVLAYTATAVAALREVRRVLHRVDDRNKPAREAERTSRSAQHQAELRAGRIERAKQRKATREREG